MYTSSRSKPGRSALRTSASSTSTRSIAGTQRSASPLLALRRRRTSRRGGSCRRTSSSSRIGSHFTRVISQYLLSCRFCRTSERLNLSVTVADYLLRQSEQRPVISRRLVDPEQRERRRGDVGEDAAVVEARRPRAVTMNGTGFVECAVFGEPSGSSMLSALPWSAVTISAPPALVHRLDDAAEALVDGLDRARPRPGSRRSGRPCRGSRS